MALRAVDPIPEGVVLALDDLGMARVPVATLAMRVRAPWALVLLCPREGLSPWLGPWREAGLGEVVSPANLPARYEQLRQTPVLPLAPAADWEPRALRDAVRARLLLDSIPVVSRPAVSEWADALGVHTRTLHAGCVACFGLSPLGVLWARTDAMVCRERGARVDAEVLAAVAGYSDWAALSKAYRRRGLPVPRPDLLPVADPIRPYRDSDPAVALVRSRRQSVPCSWTTGRQDDRTTGLKAVRAARGRARIRTRAARTRRGHDRTRKTGFSAGERTAAMAGQTIVFFPRYTTLVTGTYFSDPYDVTRYKSIEAQTLNAAVINSATLSVQLQQSSDLVTWTDVGSAMAPAVNDTDVESLSGTARYIRAKATIAGTNATAVFWAKAVARDC